MIHSDHVCYERFTTRSAIAYYTRIVTVDLGFHLAVQRLVPLQPVTKFARL